MSVVADASVLVEVLVDSRYADVVRGRLRDDPSVWAPHLVDAEVGHALRSVVRRGLMSPAAAAAALRDLADLPLRRAAHRDLMEVAWVLRDNLTFYDALYVALATVLDAPLLTLDHRLAAVPGLPATVEMPALPSG